MCKKNLAAILWSTSCTALHSGPPSFSRTHAGLPLNTSPAGPGMENGHHYPTPILSHLSMLVFHCYRYMSPFAPLGTHSKPSLFLPCQITFNYFPLSLLPPTGVKLSHTLDWPYLVCMLLLLSFCSSFQSFQFSSKKEKSGNAIPALQTLQRGADVAAQWVKAIP